MATGNAGEGLVVDAALRWLRYDPEGRCSTFLSEILPNIILTKATKDSVHKLLTFSEVNQREGNEIRYVFVFVMACTRFNIQVVIHSFNTSKLPPKSKYTFDFQTGKKK